MVRLVRIFLRQLFVLVQQIWISLLYALPFISGLLLATAGASLKLTADASIFALGGIRETADRASDHWTRRAIVAGFPYLWQRHLKKSFYATAVLTVFGVWLLIPLALVFIGSLLF
jgi:hypothetical protein